MFDAIKIAARVAIIVAVNALVIGIFVSFIGAIGNLIGQSNINLVVQAIGKGKAFVNYYMGGYAALLTLGFSLLTLKFVAIPLVKVELMAFKWILTINK